MLSAKGLFAEYLMLGTRQSIQRSAKAGIPDFR
jgi:hypothetical protein